jgi:hypothetical protein
MSMQLIVKKFGGALSKNSPTILTGLGIVGLVSTVSMAIRATPKALGIIDREYNGRVADAYKNKENIDVANISKQDIVKLTWKCYIPAAVTGLLTIGCIISANRVNLRRNAALLSLYGLSEAALKEYQKKVIETIGDKKERVVREEIRQDRLVKNPVSDKEVVVTGVGESLCYDALSGRYFKSDIEKIKQVLNKLSRNLMSEHFITLNEVYDALNLKSTKMGENIGWHIDDGLIEPDFSSHLTENGVPCLVLDYATEPRYNYNNY